MRFVILGAGAVGGTIGGRMADADHDVVLVARGEHAEVLREQGLRLATPDRVIRVHPEVVESPDELDLRDDDVLVLATKTHQTAAVLEALPRRDLPVVCAQNGVDNERQAARLFPDVYAVVVMLPAVHLEPGRVDAQGTPYSGLLDVGRFPHGIDQTARDIARAFASSGFVSKAVPDIMRWKYAKLLRNLGNVLEALCGHDLDRNARQLLHDLERRARNEAERCFRAAGIQWASDDEWGARRQLQVEYAPVEGRDRSGGSTWQSLARGAGALESDFLNGEIALLGRIHGIRTPVNAMLQQVAFDAARAGIRPGSVRPQQLADAVGTMGR